MFGLGLPEIGLIVVIALIVFGPAKLPELGKSVGKAIGEFKRAGSEITKEVTAPLEEKKVENKDKT